MFQSLQTFTFIIKEQLKPQKQGLVVLDVPVVRIARAVGSTRQSVYNWMKGGEVFVAYRPAVERIIEILQASKTSEEAWSKICKAFNLHH